MSLGPAASCGATEVGESEFWAFSVDFYGRPSVSSHCLALQDASGADVNLILLLLYAATKGIALSVDHVAQLDRSCAEWRESVIRPLRAARRATKTLGMPDAGQLYSALKSAEIASEKVAQYRLARGLHELSRPTDSRTPSEVGRANLLAYSDLLPLPEVVVEDLLVAFSDLVHQARYQL